MNPAPILIVDDEPSVLAAIRRALRAEAVSITDTTLPREALELLSHQPFAVILADHRMPDMEGIQLLERARAVAPDTVRIILTGHADVRAAIDSINRGAVYRFLTKPWDDEELCIVIRQAVALYNLVEDKKRAEQRVLENERHRVMLESLGTACHHLGQPCTALLLNLNLLQARIESLDAETQDILQECLQAAKAIAEILHRLIQMDEYRTVPYLESRGGSSGRRDNILDIGERKT